jgi:hypothetical protein
VVDYGIICRNILDKINYFKVHPLTTFSDHCMISTDIDVKIRPASKHIKMNCTIFLLNMSGIMNLRINF